MHFFNKQFIHPIVQRFIRNGDIGDYVKNNKITWRSLNNDRWIIIEEEFNECFDMFGGNFKNKKNKGMNGWIFDFDKLCVWGEIKDRLCYF